MKNKLEEEQISIFLNWCQTNLRLMERLQLIGPRGRGLLNGRASGQVKSEQPAGSVVE